MERIGKQQVIGYTADGTIYKDEYYSGRVEFVLLTWSSGAGGLPQPQQITLSKNDPRVTAALVAFYEHGKATRI